MNATAPATAEEIWDVVVVGAGAGGLTAACAAAAEGRSVLLLEQGEVVGGTTAISGGMVWLPANHKTAEAGRLDTIEAARTYLAATVPGTDRRRLETFLAHADEALRWLEARTSLRLKPVLTYPDYQPDLPGATLGGRVLEPVAFDARVLGANFALVRDPLPEFTLFGGMMICRQDIPHLRRAKRSPRSALHTARLLLRHAYERLSARRGTTLHLGNALVARRALRAARCKSQPSSAKASAAGAMIGEWKAPETFNLMTRLAPAAFSTSSAVASSLSVPDMTHWTGLL